MSCLQQNKIHSTLQSFVQSACVCGCNVQKTKTHFMFNNFFPENCVVYEIMWKNIVERGRPQTTIQS